VSARSGELHYALGVITQKGIMSKRMQTQFESLRDFYNKVRDNSEFVPSEGEAADFVFYTTALREQLSGKIKKD
jgi:hypothetical protein